MKRLIAIMLLLASGLMAKGDEAFSVSARLLPEDEQGRRLEVVFRVADGHYLYRDQMSVEPEGAPQLLPGEIPEPKMKHDPFTETMVGVYDHDVTFTYLVTGDLPDLLSIRIGYQGCSEAVCFMPMTKTLAINTETGDAVEPQPGREKLPTPAAPALSQDWRQLAEQFTVAGSTTGYVKADRLMEFLDAAAAGTYSERDALSDSFKTKGIWLTVVLILLGGLALNLTPCVLPMIPINIAIIGAGAQAASRLRGTALGAAYGGGITIVYGVLGVVAVLTGAQFGVLNSSPWFNIAIAIMFLALALAMFDVFLIDFSRFQTRIGTDQSKSGSFYMALILGGVAALLAGACVAPVVISVLLLSANIYAGGNPAGLVLPFLLGVGMALPWPFAGAGLSFLPKPGKWMNRVKYVFGIFILLFAGWYAYLGVSLLRDRSETSRATVTAAQQETIEQGWLTELDQALAVAKREGKPVFIDFWASWCKNCLKMEKTTFRDPEVTQRLESFVKLKYEADNIREPAVKAVLDHFDVMGLPTYIVLRP